MRIENTKNQGQESTQLSQHRTEEHDDEQNHCNFSEWECAQKNGPLKEGILTS